MAVKKKNKEAEGGGRKSKELLPSNITGSTAKVKSASSDATPDLTPYSIFLRCIGRSQNLINFHSEDQNPQEDQFCDAYRAAVVLTIAALDAYTRTVAIIKIKEKIRKKLKPKDPLRLYFKKIISHEGLLESALNESFFDDIENLISNDFHQKSFQGDENITEYMELAGYKNIIGYVAEKSKLNEKTLKKEINEYTKRRHSIAHNGDYATNQQPIKELEITKEYAIACHKLISEFTRVLDEICFKK